MTQAIIDKYHLVPGKLEHPEIADSVPYEWPEVAKGYDCYLIADGKQTPAVTYRLWVRNKETTNITFVDIAAEILVNDSSEIAAQKVRDLILTKSK